MFFISVFLERILDGFAVKFRHRDAALRRAQSTDRTRREHRLKYGDRRICDVTMGFDHSNRMQVIAGPPAGRLVVTEERVRPL
jgi:hypothetical protein